MSATSAAVPESEHVQSIRFLSSYLHGVRYGLPASIPSTPDKKVDAFTHLANILDLGHDVLAVTGATSPDKVDAAIMVSSDRSKISNNSTAGVEAVVLTATAPTAINFEGPPPLVPSIQQHAEDLLSILQNRDALAVDADKFCLWIVFRCHKKLARRLTTSWRQWRLDPLIAMERWKPGITEPPELAPTVSETFPEGVSRILIEYGLKPHRGTLTTFTFSLECAPSWVGLIAHLVLDLQTLLPDVGEQAPPKRVLEEADSLLRVLVRILLFGPISQLFKLSSLGHIFAPELDYARSLLADDDDGLPQAPGESNGEHVFRYLQSLVAWHSAAVYLLQMREFSQISATIITLSAQHDYIGLTGTGVDTLKASIIQEIDNAKGRSGRVRETAKQLFREHAMTLSHFMGHVHAEAGLMAVANASYAHASFVDNDLRRIFERQYTLSIGGTTQCCWICWRLSQKVFGPQTADEARNETRREVNLPGAHGMVFPWDPPALGIPEDALKSIALELKLEVVRRVLSNASAQVLSRQSSPRPDAFPDTRPRHAKVRFRHFASVHVYRAHDSVRK